MADVFISYAREDRALVAPIAAKLSELGLSVWFDARLQAGTPFDKEIEAEIKLAAAVLVCWSARAVQSTWVRAESIIALGAGKLIACRLGDCDLPPPFNVLHTQGLSGWDGGWPDERFAGVLLRVGQLAHRPDLADAARAIVHLGPSSAQSGFNIPTVKTQVATDASKLAASSTYVLEKKPDGSWTSRPQSKNGLVAWIGLASMLFLIVGTISAMRNTSNQMLEQGVEERAPPASPAPASSAVAEKPPEPVTRTPRQIQLDVAVKKAELSAQQSLDVTDRFYSVAEDLGAFIDSARLGAPNTFIGRLPSGETYEGAWSNEKPNGYGRMTTVLTHGTEVYSGQWKEGVRVGVGQLELVQEDQLMYSYAGQWKDGIRAGLGTERNAKSEEYRGEFRAGQRSGFGTLVMPDGREYAGEFKSGSYSGLGVLRGKNETIEGLWRDGKLVERFNN